MFGRTVAHCTNTRTETKTEPKVWPCSAHISDSFHGRGTTAGTRDVSDFHHSLSEQTHKMKNGTKQKEMSGENPCT